MKVRLIKTSCSDFDNEDEVNKLMLELRFLSPSMKKISIRGRANIGIYLLK